MCFCTYHLYMSLVYILSVLHSKVLSPFSCLESLNKFRFQILWTDSAGRILEILSYHASSVIIVLSYAQ